MKYITVLLLLALVGCSTQHEVNNHVVEETRYCLENGMTPVQIVNWWTGQVTDIECTFPKEDEK